MCVSATGIWQDKHRDVVQLRRLESKVHSLAPGDRKEHPVNGHPEQRDDLWAIALYGGNKPLLSNGIFTRPELIDTCAGSLNDVGQTEAPVGQAPIVLVSQWLGYELRLIQEFPEPIRVTGEVMAYGCRSKAWVDADEEDPNSRLNMICEPFKRVSLGSLSYWCACHRFGQIAGSFHLKLDQDVPFLGLRRFSRRSAILPQKSEGVALRIRPENYS